MQDVILKRYCILRIKCVYSIGAKWHLFCYYWPIVYVGGQTTDALWQFGNNKSYAKYTFSTK